MRERDDDFSDGCEYSHFIFGNDEAALGSDMGLMFSLPCKLSDLAKYNIYIYESSSRELAAYKTIKA